MNKVGKYLGFMASTLLLTTNSAFAAPIITGASSFPLVDLGIGNGGGLQPTSSPLVVSGLTITFSGTAGVYSGSSSIAVSPFGPSNNTNYLATQPGYNVTVSFPTTQTSYSLLWGSINGAPYNVLSFNSGETVTGSQVESALGVADTANVWVHLTNLQPFTSVTASDPNPSFEFVPAALTPVPVPPSLALFGSGLVGIGMGAIPRKKKARTG